MRKRWQCYFFRIWGGAESNENVVSNTSKHPESLTYSTKITMAPLTCERYCLDSLVSRTDKETMLSACASRCSLLYFQLVQVNNKNSLQESNKTNLDYKVSWENQTLLTKLKKLLLIERHIAFTIHNVFSTALPNSLSLSLFYLSHYFVSHPYEWYGSVWMHQQRRTSIYAQGNVSSPITLNLTWFILIVWLFSNEIMTK